MKRPAQWATASALAPVTSSRSPSRVAICTAKLPTVELSGDPRKTSSPVASAVRRLRNAFWLAPPTMNRRFSLLPVSRATRSSTAA